MDINMGGLKERAFVRSKRTVNYPSKLIFNYKYLFLICTTKRHEARMEKEGKRNDWKSFSHIFHSLISWLEFFLFLFDIFFFSFKPARSLILVIFERKLLIYFFSSIFHSWRFALAQNFFWLIFFTNIISSTKFRISAVPACHSWTTKINFLSEISITFEKFIVFNSRFEYKSCRSN